MQDLPNGFTGFAKRASDPNYQYTRSNDQRDSQPAQPLSEEAVDAIPEIDRRWAWVEIDRSAIQYNVLQTKKQLESGCRLLAVVKADGYGHGAVQVAKAATSAGRAIWRSPR